MALQKISDFDQEYRDAFNGKDVKGMSVYAEGNNEKIGTVSDALVDEEGRFRYLIVDLGFWIFGKKVLLPVGRSNFDLNADRVSTAMTKAQAENLPEYKEGMSLDYDYEEQVRGVYRNPASSASADYDRSTYSYAQDADLYDTSANADQTIKLYEERLVANKQRRKSGEVAIGKHVETETAKVAVPIEKERVVVERVIPSDAGKAVDPEASAFREGEVAHVELYEEVPDVRKEAFVREEVTVKKVVDTETVETKETVRREELDVDSEGRPITDKTKSL